MSALDLKNRFARLNPFRKEEEEDSYKETPDETLYDEAGYEDDASYTDDAEYNETEAYEDEYDEDAEYDENAEYDDDEYADAYEDEAEADGEDEYYDEASDDEDLYGEENADSDDGYEDEADYDEAEYDEADYDEADYDDGYLDEEEQESEPDADELGFNPDLLKKYGGNSDSDEDGEYADDEYEDEDYEGDDDGGDVGGTPGWLIKSADAIEGNPILFYALILVPFLSVIPLILMWARKMFDTKKRWIITGICAAAFIIWLWIFGAFSGSPSDDPTSPSFGNTDIGEPSFATEVPTATPTASAEPNTAEPSATPHAGTEEFTGFTVTDTNYVYTTTANIYYHTIPDCGGLSNADKVEISLAQSQGKRACPDCAGGVNTYADPVTETTYYCTPGGTYYHVNPTCSKMSGASAVTLENAVSAGKKACPTCIGYYGTDGGKYYHCISNCQGMQNAVTKTKEEWAKTGKSACPTCLKNTNDVTVGVSTTETQVWATQGGTYYHTKNNCSGMANATQVSLSKAIKNGKVACSKCVTKSNVKVFATAKGTYYHTKATCSGMAGAEYVTAKAAISAGKKPCPKCDAGKLFGGTASAAEGTSVVTLSNGKTASADEATTVYYTKTGNYFHTSKTCSGMSGATASTVKSAVSAGKKACPTCVTKTRVYVYATGSGTYFHTDSDCSGMAGAQRVTAKVAIEAGKKPCTKCGASKLFAASEIVPAATQSTTAATSVYATKDGKYFHTKNNCSGMKGATKITYADAIKAGKKLCTTCVKPSSITVYYNTDGKYFHTVSNCSGMSGAVSATASKAMSAGKTACPTCAKALASNTSASSTSAAASGTKTSATASASTLLYIETGTGASDYYHMAAKCGGKSVPGALNVTLEYVLNHGYKACPVCNPPSKIYS